MCYTQNPAGPSVRHDQALPGPRRAPDFPALLTLGYAALGYQVLLGVLAYPAGFSAGLGEPEVYACHTARVPALIPAIGPRQAGSQ